MLKKLFFAAVCLLLGTASFAALNVVASSQDLAYIAGRVGGSHVKAQSLTAGDEDQHYVEARPSMVMALKKADAFVRIGMELDMWADSLVIASRNGRIVRGKDGNIDASVDIEKLEVPKGKIDLAMGDIHAFGNPHYWLDPHNAVVVAGTLAERFSLLDPANASAYKSNAAAFSAEIAARLKEWQKRMAPFAGRKVAVYHDSWPYFAKRFGLSVAAEIELKPGIPPTPSHIAELVSLMKREQVGVILCETYYDGRTVRSLAEKTGAKVAAVAVSVGGKKGIKTYEELMDSIISSLETAFK